MKIHKWEDTLWINIPNQDRPIKGEECLTITRTILATPEYIKAWQVIRQNPEYIDDKRRGLESLGIFYDFDKAELFAENWVRSREI